MSMLQQFTFALLLSVASIRSYAQPKIEGLGIFKFGKSPAETVHEYAKSHKLLIVKVSSVGFKESLGVMRQLIYKPAQPLEFQSVNTSACPETEIYYLGHYDVSGLAIKNLYLTYYKQGLIKLRCEGSSELNDALRIKYGDPKMTSRKEWGKCGESVTYYQQWKTEETEMLSMFIKFYDLDCKKGYQEALMLDSMKLDRKEADECHQSTVGKETNERVNERKRELKDL